MRIVRLANFVTAKSGGLRTALRELGAGYAAAGHDPVLVVPGETYTRESTDQGEVITLPGPLVPGTGGYRVLVNRWSVARLLESLAPDRIEVSDRSTLRWTGTWARRHGVGSVMVSHESLAGLLRLAGSGGAATERVAGQLNAWTAARYDRIVCTTSWAAEEFRRIGVRNLDQVPLGVDLSGFHPDRYDAALRAGYVAGDELLLVHCSRLSAEKCPERSLTAVAELRRRGVAARLVVAGSGPLEERMRHRATGEGLPVTFEGFVADRERLAGLLASADAVLAPGPVETFGLAALEALASGTPVVVSAQSALPEVVGEAGAAAPGHGEAYADAVLELMARPEADRRRAARRRAETYTWPAAVSGFLRVHENISDRPRRVYALPRS
ncbi:MAG: glycosyltransferase [Micromonosporaceae bacterium]